MFIRIFRTCKNRSNVDTLFVIGGHFGGIQEAEPVECQETNLNKPHIYKITNNISKKFYYGVHNGSNTDYYKGSGKLLKRAYDKHGPKAFTKEILMWFDTEAEAYEYEAVIVNQKLVDNPMCYNIKLGGIGGGWTHSDCSKGGKASTEKMTHDFRVSCGKKSARSPRHVNNQTVICPHCGKEGSVPNMKRWHFEKCKKKL